MAIDLNDEIVQDFLVEAGEILELLNEQAVDLETSPDDAELLNAVFRGFHTIKGGAGFLAMDSLVHVAHKCEDIFDLLRQGERKIDADLMDIVLNVLDVLNDMFDEIRTGEDPTPAPAELMGKLSILADKDGVLDTGAPVVETTNENSDPDITEQEFDEIVDALSGKEVSEQKVAGEEKAITQIEAKEGDITEEEFEALLDDLHGSGGSPTTADASEEGAVEEKAITKMEAKEGDITEDEFDQLLDDLHGKGKHGEVNVAETDQAALEQSPVEKDPSQKEAEPVKEPEAKKEAEPKAEKPEPAKESKPKPKAKTPPPTAESTVRVETSTLDSIMNLVGELVLIRNRMSNLEESIGNEDMTKTAASLDVITSDLQSVVLKTRMQPIKKIFGKFPRVVRDLARTLGREINLEMSGEDTDLDKNLVEALADPLVHLVRNAVDHGIEMPDVRESNGKNRQGTLKLGAAQEGDHVLITISDDGAGMDPNVLRDKAVEKGMMDAEAAARLDDKECFELIFSAGFSTKVEISDVSGRGVGMDVVKTRISQLNGIVEIDSKLGEGTTLSIKLPLTLAIMPTLMVILGEQIFALPLVNVKEIMDFEQEETNVVDGQNVLVVRGRALPIFNLSKWLTVDAGFGVESKTPGHVVIVNVGTQQVGLLVDHLIGQEEVVIKPLGSNLQGTKGLAGATITGDGRIALILDLPSLINHYATRYN